MEAATCEPKEEIEDRQVEEEEGDKEKEACHHADSFFHMVPPLVRPATVFYYQLVACEQKIRNKGTHHNLTPPRAFEDVDMSQIPTEQTFQRRKPSSEKSWINHLL